MTPAERAAQVTATFPGTLHELLGMVIDEIEPGRAAGRLTVRPSLFAGNGFLHAATFVGLADSLCGFGCLETLPEGASGFTTVELKANYLGTVREGELLAEAVLVHGGRTTQLWDATVTGEGPGRPLALFRCTQLVLYPR